MIDSIIEGLERRKKIILELREPDFVSGVGENIGNPVARLSGWGDFWYTLLQPLRGVSILLNLAAYITIKTLLHVASTLAYFLAAIVGRAPSPYYDFVPLDANGEFPIPKSRWNSLGKTIREPFKIVFDSSNLTFLYWALYSILIIINVNRNPLLL